VKESTVEMNGTVVGINRDVATVELSNGAVATRFAVELHAALAYHHQRWKWRQTGRPMTNSR
jgi:hypothetical protein